MIELFIAFYIVCAVLVYGFSFAYFHNSCQKLYPVNLIFCLAMSFFGVSSLMAYTIIFGTEGFKYGLKFW